MGIVPRLLLVLLLGVVLLALGLNTPAGLRAVTAAARRGGVEITGLAGRFPDDLHAARVTVADADGVWLEIDGPRLDWSPIALLGHEIRAESLVATRVHVARYPSGGGGGGGFNMAVAIAALHVARVELPELIFSVDGAAGYRAGVVDLTATAATADAFGQGAMALSGHLAGPLGAATFSGTLETMGQHIAAGGTLDLDHLTADLALGIDKPALAGVTATHLDATLKAGIAAVDVHASLTGLNVPGLPAPLGRTTQAHIVLDLGQDGTDLVVTADAALAGVVVGAYRQDLRLGVSGKLNALAFRLGMTGTAALTATGVLDANANRLGLNTLEATLAGQTITLAAPTSLALTPQVVLAPSRLVLGGSTLDLSGRLSPTLDLAANLSMVPAELARWVDPTWNAAGTLQAQARLQGTLAQPTGRVTLSGAGLRLLSAPKMPPVALEATATLQGAQAQLDARATAGATELILTGSVPLRAGGEYALVARGHGNLTVLDPFLASAGMQLRGEMRLDGTLTGTPPVPAGTLTLANGALTLPNQGVRLSDIRAVLRAQPDRLVLEGLTAKAGAGTLTGTGSLGLASPMPVAITLTARHASPITSDALTSVFDADISLGGAVQQGMAATGTVRISRAEITIPQHLPSNLPVLALRQKGVKPAPPPPPEFPLALDVTLTAPGQIFVRGHGLDAELGGSLHLGGTTAAMRPEGGFTLRRGQFSLAGQTLNFTSGRVFFDGHVPVDPSLDFAATSGASTGTATLAITGNASHPTIRLSSVPILPQDEVLAQLLFHRSAAELGPLQLAQMATALAQIADIGGSGALDPLGAVRRRLGLDVLSVGGAPGASPTVEAGRNLGSGIYVGAKQATSGAGSQATVRLDLAPGLKLEADVGVAPAASTVPGAPPTGNQVGVTYEREY